MSQSVHRATKLSRWMLPPCPVQRARRELRCWLLTLVVLGTPASALAAEVTVQNDSAIDGSAATPCQCFLAGESVAAWLTAPADGDIVAVQIFWKSEFGGAPDSLESSISIFGAGSFPTPGAVLQNASGDDAIVSAPVLSDGSFNEFRFLDQAASIPVSVSVTQGQTFVVSLELFNQSSGNPFAASTAWDSDTCQGSRNAVFVIPGGWTDACLAGVPGDWVIRAVIDTGQESLPSLTSWGAVLLILLLITAATLVAPRTHSA